MKFLYFAISMLAILVTPFVFYKALNYARRPSKLEEEQYERFKDEYAKLSDSEKEEVAKAIAQRK